jgi:Winged helix DNA-binding domain
MDVSLSQALAWRRERQFLCTGAKSAAEVVRRLVAVPAWSGDPELAVRRRLARPSTDVIAKALDNGDLIKTYVFRGATHLLAAEDAGVYLAIRCAKRQWELRSWQDFYELTPDDWPALREVVRDVVAQGPVRHSELVEKVTSKPRFRHLRDGLNSDSHTLMKPLAWQGDL